MRSDLNERILIVLNKSEKKEKINIELPMFLNTTKLVDLKNNIDLRIESNSVELEIPGSG